MGFYLNDDKSESLSCPCV